MIEFVLPDILIGLTHLLVPAELQQLSVWRAHQANMEVGRRAGWYLGNLACPRYGVVMQASRALGLPAPAAADNTVVLSVPEGGLIATKIAKERMRKRVARRPLQRSTTLSATLGQPNGIG